MRTACVVQLPDTENVPLPWRGKQYVIKKLLGGANSNPKLAKSNKAGTPWQTWGLGMAPAKESGFQMCSSSSAGCRSACLFFQGQARMDPTIIASRIAKTIAFKTRRDWFEDQLVHELTTIGVRAAKDGFRVAFRPNLTTDVMWEKEWPGLFESFPDFTIYDYTKHHKRMLRFCAGEFPPNYHLTFSRSETNDQECKEVLKAGGNVAVVFRGELPRKLWGYTVVDGDGHDLRFIEPDGVVVGLKAKGTAKHDDSGFVLDPPRVRRQLAVLA